MQILAFLFFCLLLPIFVFKGRVALSFLLWNFGDKLAEDISRGGWFLVMNGVPANIHLFLLFLLFLNFWLSRLVKRQVLAGSSLAHIYPANDVSKDVWSGHLFLLLKLLRESGLNNAFILVFLSDLDYSLIVQISWSGNTHIAPNIFSLSLAGTSKTITGVVFAGGEKGGDVVALDHWGQVGSLIIHVIKCSFFIDIAHLWVTHGRNLAASADCAHFLATRLASPHLRLPRINRWLPWCVSAGRWGREQLAARSGQHGVLDEFAHHLEVESPDTELASIHLFPYLRLIPLPNAHTALSLLKVGCNHRGRTAHIERIRRLRVQGWTLLEGIDWDTTFLF